MVKEYKEKNPEVLKLCNEIQIKRYEYYNSFRLQRLSEIKKVLK